VVGVSEVAVSNAKADCRKVILVVDDDAGARGAMCELLDAEGYSVLQAENGQEALDLLENAPDRPCLIVLDLAMPVLDGYEFLTLRSQDPVLSEIPVAVVSGNQITLKPLDGIDVFLRKPVNVDTLIEAIARRC
jgi:CheY-like chemotaxis protein